MVPQELSLVLGCADVPATACLAAVSLVRFVCSRARQAVADRQGLSICYMLAAAHKYVFLMPKARVTPLCSTSLIVT